MSGEGEVRFVSSAQEMLARDFVDAILADVFQGKREHLRDHMLGVVAKVTRKHPWPHFEECVEAEVAHRVRGGDPRGWLRVSVDSVSTVSTSECKRGAFERSPTGASERESTS